MSGYAPVGATFGRPCGQMFRIRIGLRRIHDTPRTGDHKGRPYEAPSIETVGATLAVARAGRGSGSHGFSANSRYIRPCDGLGGTSVGFL